MKLHKLISIKADSNTIYAYLTTLKKQKEWLPELVDMKIKKGKNHGEIYFESSFLEGSKIHKRNGKIHEHIKGQKLVVELYDKNINAQTAYFLQQNEAGFCNLDVTIQFKPAKILAWLILPLVFLYGKYALGKKLQNLKEIVEAAN